MSIENPAYRAAQVFTEPLFWTPAQLADGTLAVIGPLGDLNPRSVLCDVRIDSVGAKQVYVAKRLVDVISGVNRFAIPATSGLLELRGDVDTLYIYNVSGSAGTADVKVQAALTARKNSGWLGGHPAHGDIGIRATPVANAVTVYAGIAPWDITVTACKTWSKVVCSGGTGCTATVTGNGNNLLNTANINVQLLTTATLQSQALTATTANLNIDRGKPIVVTVTGTVGITPGDLLFALEYTLRNPA